MPRGRTPKVKRACDTCRTRKIKHNDTGHGFTCTYAPSTQYRTKPGSRNAQVHLRGKQADLQEPQHITVDRRMPASWETVASRDGPGTSEDLDGLNELNTHTEGTEFHGASGAWAFLSKLRSKAHDAQRQDEQAAQPLPPSSPTFSVVSYLHNPDHVDPVNNGSSRQLSLPPTSRLPPSLGLEKAAVLLYFDGLHIVHPFLDKESFIHRCEKEIWSPITGLSTTAQCHFSALYDVVLALGLITANEDSINHRDIGLADDLHTAGSSNTSVETVQWAEFFFRRAKANLGDVFHASSIDAAAALFLMSVYCQNALRPHSCYLYSGMAVRTALACGIDSKAQTKVLWSGRLWWALYSHELEMCSSVGRSTALASPKDYLIPVPVADQDTAAGLIECMVRFADIHRRISTIAYPSVSSDTWSTRSIQAMKTESKLKDWKTYLGSALDYDEPSFTDPEWRLKQKLVLRLRYSNARILLHRPFFSSTGVLNSKTAVIDHISPCVDASISTIDVLYTAYTYRPWFRTWWYNTTYLLYAEMVILYILLSDIEIWPETSLREKAQQGLSILESMNQSMVARNCATVVREVLSIVTKLSDSKRNRRQMMPSVTFNSETTESHSTQSPQENYSIGQQEELAKDVGLVEDCEDLFYNLADSSFFDDLLRTEMWHLDPT